MESAELKERRSGCTELMQTPVAGESSAPPDERAALGRLTPAARPVVRGYTGTTTLPCRRRMGSHRQRYNLLHVGAPMKSTIHMAARASQ
jgi:hypothetical protein